MKILHRATGAELFSDGSDSLKTTLENAIRRGAYLGGAYLEGAYLRGADLAISAGWPNGWHAFGWLKDKSIYVQVGCRNLSLAEGREYWAGKDDRREVLAALDYIETVAKLRGWEIKES